MRNSGFQKFFAAIFALAAAGFCSQAAAQGPQVVVNTGNTDGKLGALSRPASANKIETETADDFFLNQTTVLTGATITGLLTNGATLANLKNVEVEIYHGKVPRAVVRVSPIRGNFRCVSGRAHGVARRVLSARVWRSGYCGVFSLWCRHSE